MFRKRKEMVENKAKPAIRERFQKIKTSISNSVYESANEAEGRSGCWMRECTVTVVCATMKQVYSV